MSKLGQLLSYLERPGVTELVFRSGVPAVMHSANRLHPLTVAPLQVSQIRRFFEGTQVIASLPKGAEVPAQTATMELLGVTYQVTIGGSAEALEVRIGKHAPSSTWSDLPNSDVPVARERRPSSAGSPASRLVEREHDSSSGMLAASPEWTIERNDDFGLAHPVAGTLRDVDAISLRSAEREASEPPLSPEGSTTPAAASPRGGRATSAASPAAQGSVPVPRPRVSSRPVSGPSLAADEPTPGPAAAQGSAPVPRPRVSSRPVSGPSPAAHGPATMYGPVPGPHGPAARPGAAHGPAPAPGPTAAHGPTAAPGPTARGWPAPRMPARGGAPLHARLREILVMARQHAASDVHVMASNPVRMRRRGALEPMGGPVAPAEVEAMAGSLLPPAHAMQLETLGYADLAADIEGAGRVRINVSRQRTGLKLCFRLVVSEPPSIATLGLPPEVRRLAVHHQGLVIVSGPNGHGKTTSMAALVDLFNAEHSLHIITVEDPVEVVHPRKQAIVTQREVGTHTRSFARALTAALREDPDVIAIGELRDRETVEMALSAAETGHLVIATMSTPSGAKTIDRLIDMFPPDDQAQVRATLAGALKLVLSQRLLRRADGSGLVAAFEMISGGVPLWSLIRDNKLFQLPSLLQRGRNFGMIGLEDSLRELLGQGLITHEEALVYADDPKALAPRDASSTAPPPGASGAGWRAGRGR